MLGNLMYDGWMMYSCTNLVQEVTHVKHQSP